jgi:hypothetical protein
MTKAELKKILDRAIAYHGFEPSFDQHERLAEAWWAELGHLDPDPVLAAVRRLSAEPRLPNPITVRAEAAGAPDPYEAWAEVLRRADAVNSGQQGWEIHPAVAETVRRLGGSNRLGGTNGDRDVFVTMYKKVLVATLP